MDDVTSDTPAEIAAATQTASSIHLAIDPDVVTAGELERFLRSRVKGVVTWLERHAHVDSAQLRALPATQILPLRQHTWRTLLEMAGNDPLPPELDLATLTIGDLEDLDNQFLFRQGIDWLAARLGVERSVIEAWPARALINLKNRIIDAAESAG